MFVCPSSYEPFGRVIVEALDGGVPVVATDAQGPRDLRARYPIELVPRDDVAAARRRAAAPCGGRSSARRVDLSEFDLECTAERMEQAYRSALVERSSSARRAAGR